MVCFVFRKCTSSFLFHKRGRHVAFRANTPRALPSKSATFSRPLNIDWVLRAANLKKSHFFSSCGYLLVDRETKINLLMLMMTDVTASPCEVREVGCEAYENITLQNPSANVSYSSLQKRSSRVTFD